MSFSTLLIPRHKKILFYFWNEGPGLAVYEVFRNLTKWRKTMKEQSNQPNQQNEKKQKQGENQPNRNNPRPEERERTGNRDQT
jgi:hypothetical protein